jgi:hypothetical protein
MNLAKIISIKSESREDRKMLNSKNINLINS